MLSPISKSTILGLYIILLFLFVSVIASVEQNKSLNARKPQKKNTKVITSHIKPHPHPIRKRHSYPKRSPQPNAAELEKQEFLAAHNNIRRFFGEPPLRWDSSLALYAKNYFLMHRYNDCEMIHSTAPHGENLFWGSGKEWKPSDAVRAWGEEVKYYNSMANTCMNGKMCGHYTQIVWRDSLRVGCFRTFCRNGNTYIICSYDSPGNFAGERPFDSHV